MIKIEINERKSAYETAQADKVYPTSGGYTTVSEGCFRYNEEDMGGLFKDIALSDRALFFWVERLEKEGNQLIPTGDYYKLWLGNLTRVAIPMTSIDGELVRDYTVEMSRASGDVTSLYRNSDTVASFLKSLNNRPFNVDLMAEVETTAFDRATGKPSLTKTRKAKVYNFDFEQKLKVKAKP